MIFSLSLRKIGAPLRQQIHAQRLVRGAIRVLSASTPYCAEDIETNPYFEKYGKKIKKAQKEGLYTPQGEVHDRRLHQETKKWKESIEKVESQLEGKKQKSITKSGANLPGSLEELIHMELFESSTSEEVGAIWTDYFKEKECVSAVIPADIFDLMITRSKECPLFLYPLPREHGYEFILSQFSGKRCFFTSLLNYQAHGDNSPWQLCLTYYAELKETKGVVLMASEIDANSLNVLAAQYLAQLQQVFYATSEQKFEIVKAFNFDPDSFKYMDLITEVESSNLIVKNPGA